MSIRLKIKAVDLTRVFRTGSTRITAVDKANLEVEDTGFVAIVGPSGSGKTTLLNLIGLNDKPTYGTVFFDEKDTLKINDQERRLLRLTKVGFIFQNFNLFPTLSALENVELSLMLAKVSQSGQRERALKLLELVGLEARVSHRPRELSMGEMQRVAIARALANKPEMIVADEPTGELGSKTAKEILSLLSEISRKERTTTIVATHDLTLVEMADTVYKIQDGKLEPES